MNEYRCEEQVDDDPEVSREWDQDKVPHKPDNPAKAKKGTKKGIKKAVKGKASKKK
jgi:hypothetical protein